jgi:hypothetical protein
MLLKENKIRIISINIEYRIKKIENFSFVLSTIILENLKLNFFKIYIENARAKKLNKVE